MEEIIDRETNLKNEVVAAYGEVLRKLKVTKQPEEHADLSDIKNPIKPLEISEAPLDKNFSDLKKYFLSSLAALEETLRIEQKKINNLENETVQKTQEKKKEEQDYIARRDAQREKERMNHETARREEEKEYIYQRDLQREKDRHQYEMAKRDAENKLKEHEARMLAREEDYRRVKEKESWILAREQEYYLLKEKVEQFPQELARSAQKTEKNITEHLTLKYEYEVKLFHMEIEAERKIHQQTVAALEAKIAHLESLKYSFSKLAFNSMETTVI